MGLIGSLQQRPRIITTKDAQDLEEWKETTHTYSRTKNNKKKTNIDPFIYTTQGREAPKTENMHSYWFIFIYIFIYTYIYIMLRITRLSEGGGICMQCMVWCCFLTLLCLYVSLCLRVCAYGFDPKSEGILIHSSN